MLCHPFAIVSTLKACHYAQTTLKVRKVLDTKSHFWRLVNRFKVEHCRELRKETEIREKHGVRRFIVSVTEISDCPSYLYMGIIIA